MLRKIPNKYSDKTIRAFIRNERVALNHTECLSSLEYLFRYRKIIFRRKGLKYEFASKQLNSLLRENTMLQEEQVAHLLGLY